MQFTRASRVRGFVISILCGALLGAIPASAEEFSATDFRVKDPVITPGGYGSSASYRLFGNISQVALGTSTATGFTVLSGFLGFPSVTLPTVSATAGDASASLSWSVSSGALGWVVSGYSIGYSATSGGPYNYSSVGSTTSGTVSSLTNGTTYYFVVLPEDAFGNRIATSSQTSTTPASSGSQQGTSGGGSTGGGGGIVGLLGTTSPLIILPALPVPGKKRTFQHNPSDFNNDFTVDIIDLSILLYFLDEPRAEGGRFDLNSDDIIDLVDVSIMFYLWGPYELET